VNKPIGYGPFKGVSTWQHRPLSICAESYCAWIWISKFWHFDANY